MNRRLIIAVLFALAAFTTAASAVPITFQVRMSHQVELGDFDPDVDVVDLAGSFNGWGTSPLTALADADGDTIYEVVVDGFTPSETIEYKFRLNGEWGGTEEFPGYGFNRVYTVEPSDNVILVWYDDDEPTGETGEDGALHWWNDAVFYEVFVRSFQDSDGDGIGDLQGLTQRLDYLNDGDPSTDDDLGVTGIWLMPVNDSPSYHGYDATNYRTINPDYGTMADFEAFLAAAHQRGIKVIVDYVMNHCSTRHPWFTAAEAGDPTYRDWFRWSQDDPGQTGPWGQGVWHWNASGWYYGLFWSGMPDLNYDTPAVKAEMFETATYWLDDVGVDGFRLDAVLYIDEDDGLMQNTPETLQFWADYNAHVKSVKPDMMSVGEAWTATSTVLKYVTRDRLDICFEFDLSYAALGAVNDGDAGYLSSKADQVYRAYPHLQYGTFLTNHDQNRALDSVGGDIGRAKAAAGAYLTLPGVPFVYYGEEIGMVGSGAHEFVRSPMQWTDDVYAGFSTAAPWQAINANADVYNVAAEDGDTTSLLAWYRRLIHLRNDAPALRRGLHDPLFSSAGPVLAFVRSHETQTLLCLVNTSPGALSGFSLSGGSDVLVPGGYGLVNLLDPTDTIDIVVSPAFDIEGLQLDGHQTAVYEFTTTTAVGPGDELPSRGLRIESNHPNPFNPATTIRYAVPVESRVRLGVYDAAGREVRRLVDGVRPAGDHEVLWNGSDDRGRSAGSGVYVVRLEAGGAATTSKITLMK